MEIWCFFLTLIGLEFGKSKTRMVTMQRGEGETFFGQWVEHYCEGLLQEKWFEKLQLEEVEGVR